MRFLVVESLSRVMKHTSSGQYGVLSAHRADRSSKENKKAMHSLGKSIRKLGYGYKKVTGRGQEVDTKTGKTTVSKEKSYFVPKIKKKHLTALAKAHNQDYVIHGGQKRAKKSGSTSKTHLVHVKDKKAHATWKKVKPKSAQYDTQVGKKHFHFEHRVIRVRALSRSQPLGLRAQH